VDVGLFYPIDAVKGKDISIFLQIWTRKYRYVYIIWNLTCTWSDTLRPSVFPKVFLLLQDIWFCKPAKFTRPEDNLPDQNFWYN